MKRLIFLLAAIAVCFVPNKLTAQFVKTHYYSGNTSITTDFMKGGVAIDTNNNKWFGTDMGVLKFDGTTWTNYTTTNGLPSDVISCIAVDKNNNVWIGTEGDGVAKFNGTTWAAYSQHSTNNGIDSLCDNGIYAIASDLTGNVWFGSKGSGVSKYDGSSWVTYTTGLPMDGIGIAGVNYITVDAANNKWFGTDMGLAKFNGSNWAIIDVSTMDSLIDNKITSIAFDNTGNIWAGTGFGITKLNSSYSWVKNYRVVDGLYTHAVADLDIDKTGNLWVGLYTDYNNDGGITEFTGTNWMSEEINFPDSVSGDQIFQIAVDKTNDIWIAMDYGVIKISHGSGVSELTASKDISIYPNPSNGIIHLCEDFSGKNTDIYITNSSGTIVMHQQNISTLDLSHLCDGIYYVQIVTDQAVVSKQKLVLIK